jgi:formylmethanofuran dehydrogenase subunit C
MSNFEMGLMGANVPKNLIEKHERIEEKVNQIEKIYEDNNSLEELWTGTLRSFSISEEIISEIPEVKSEDLEGVLNSLLERYKNKDYNPDDLGYLVSLINNRTVEEYVRKNKEEGKEEKDIQPLSTHLKVDYLKKSISYLGYKNPEKSNLFIEGSCRDGIGSNAKGGKIEVNGNCNGFPGAFNQGGEIEVNGNCNYGAGNFMRKGKVVIKGNSNDSAAEGMEGGEVIIEGNCNSHEGMGIAYMMKGGKLVIKGELGKISTDIEGGEIWHKGKQIKNTFQEE